MSGQYEVMRAALGTIRAALADNYDHDNQPYSYITLDRETVQQAEAALASQTVRGSYKLVPIKLLLRIRSDYLSLDGNSIQSMEELLNLLTAAPAADREATND